MSKEVKRRGRKPVVFAPEVTYSALKQIAEGVKWPAGVTRYHLSHHFGDKRGYLKFRIKKVEGKKGRPEFLPVLELKGHEYIRRYESKQRVAARKVTAPEAVEQTA